MSDKSERDWEIVKGTWQVVLESNPSAADGVMQMLDQIRELRVENERLSIEAAQLEVALEGSGAEVKQLQAALEQLVDVFGPFANMGAGRPAIDQARKILIRPKK